MSYVIVARWQAREGEREKIEGILRDLVQESRREPGVKQFVATERFNQKTDGPIRSSF